MAKTKTLTQILLTLITILSSSSFATLTLKNTVAEISSKVTNNFNSTIYWQGSGPQAGYKPKSDNSVEWYIYAQNSIVNTDDYIHNSFTCNRDYYTGYRYQFGYNSAITFQASKNADDTAAIIVTAGDLYLNGSQLTRELDGSFIVPTSQDLIAMFAYNYVANRTTNSNVQYYPVPLQTTTQDIYLQGYTMPAVPEPATIGLLGLGALGSFLKRNRGGV